MSDFNYLNNPKLVELVANELQSAFEEATEGELKDQLSDIKNIYIADEQSMLREKEIDSSSIYVVVKFGSGSINYGVGYVAVSLAVLGTQNKIRPTQLLLNYFCAKYTTKVLDGDSNSVQVWAAPRVSSLFNDVNEGFRDLFDVSGTIIVGSNVVLLQSIKYKYGDSDTDVEEVPFLSFQDSFANTNSPQPFFNSDGFAKSEVNFSTNAFTVNTYLLNSHFIVDCMHAKGMTIPSGSTVTSTKTKNDIFKFTITYSNGAYSEFEYKLVNFTIGAQLGAALTVAISFSM